jgi:NADH-quinone oxidoreductase subunit L
MAKYWAHLLRVAAGPADHIGSSHPETFTADTGHIGHNPYFGDFLAESPELNHWLGDIIDGWLPAETAKLATDASFKLWIAALSVSIGLAGLATSWLIYQVRIVEPQRIRSFLEPLPEILENRFYLDALYQDVFLKLFVFGSVAWLLSLWDEYVVDGLVNGVGTTTRWVSGQIRVAQSGQAQVYASIMFFGTIAAVVGILVVSRT